MIAWFARNPVAANLLMMLMLAGGLYYGLSHIPLEYYPESEPTEISISMSYRGASPADVESAVVERIEESLTGLAGIKEIDSTASEGRASIMVEVEKGTKTRELLEDVKNRIDAINTFPEETERPTITLDRRMSRVITVIVAAKMTPRELKRLGEQVRDEIGLLPGIALASLRGARPYEIIIEISEKDLQQFGMTFDEISSAVRRSSLDLPAGAIKASSGEILLRTLGQAYNKSDFENIVLRAEPDGARVLLKQVARVRDDFEEEPLYSTFNSKPCVFVNIERTKGQNLLEIAQTVREYVAKAADHLPPGAELGYWRDNSRPVKERLLYLLENMAWGCLLVFIVLALFLRLSLAFWVCSGIPIAFAGGLIAMHFTGATINLFSLFGFIVVVGIVVDDAIVVGESVFTQQDPSRDCTEAAIQGVKAVSTPVTFGVFTSIAAFVPLIFMPGSRADIFAQIPYVVIPVLLASLLETKLILPAHLASIKPLPADPSKANAFFRLQRRLSDWLEQFLARTLYRRSLDFVLRHRYIAFALFLSVLIVAAASILSGRLAWNYMPKFYTDTVSAQLEMPLGTPADVTEKHLMTIEKAAYELQQKFREGDKSAIHHVMTTMGSYSGRSGVGNSGSSYMAEVTVELPPYDQRTANTDSGKITSEWRKLIGELPGIKELRFRDSYGFDDDPINIQIAGRSEDQELMLQVSEEIQERLKKFQHVYEVRDTFVYGKEEVQITRVRPEAEARGLTKELVARQLRQSFFGAEAQRIQRGQDDVRVMIRYPREERTSLDNLEKMRLRSPDGAEIPFGAAVDYEFSRSPSSIKREDRNRVVNVLADVDKEKVDLEGLKGEITPFLLDLKRRHPTLQFEQAGEAREQAESFQALLIGVGFVLFALYALMAIPFKSYIMPLAVMAVIPFGLVGSVVGHMIKGVSMSIFSVLGMLTLCGVIVNESLVLVDAINKQRAAGDSPDEAARHGGVSRFRAIMLTNVTTFIGFLPLIFDSHTREGFLTQMSISLAFGVMFSFFVTLYLVPINYLLICDMKKWLWGRKATKVSPPVVSSLDAGEPDASPQL